MAYRNIDVFERKEVQINVFWIIKDLKFRTKMCKLSRDWMPWSEQTVVQLLSAEVIL